MANTIYSCLCTPAASLGPRHMQCRIAYPLKLTTVPERETCSKLRLENPASGQTDYVLAPAQRGFASAGRRPGERAVSVRRNPFCEWETPLHRVNETRCRNPEWTTSLADHSMA